MGRMHRTPAAPRPPARAPAAGGAAGLGAVVARVNGGAGNRAAGALAAGLAGGGVRNAVLARRPKAPPPIRLGPEPGAPRDPDRTLEQAAEARIIIEDTLLPAYRAAIDALDAPAATELASAIVRMLLSVTGDVAGVADAVRARTSEARLGDVPIPGMEPEPPDPLDAALGENAELEAEDVAALTRAAAYQLGPRVFRGVTIAADPVPDDGGSVAAAAGEAATTLELLNTVAQVSALYAQPSTTSFQQAADLVEGWRGRPVNFLFLYAVLEQEGLLTPLLFVAGSKTGRTVAGTRAQVERASREFGMLIDVGEFELGDAVERLSYYWDDWAISDEDAMRVAEKWATASPAARMPILEKLEEKGRLERLCSNLPGQVVMEMYKTAFGRSPGSAATATLRAAVEDQPDGTTVTELYEGRIMENIEEGNYVRGYLWTFLMTAHRGLTFGFVDVHDQAYANMRAGLISADEYWSTTTKAAGRAAAILAATAVTGGAAGGFAEGVALGRGVGATAASLIGGGVGGGVAGVAGQLTADVYDQALLGKEGFSSATDYLVAAGGGALAGTATAGVGALAGRAFPASAMETFRYHSGGGSYRVLQDFRQGLHRLLYSAYRGSVSAGRRTGTGGARSQYAELFADEGVRHILEGDPPDYGGHRWPPNPEGGQRPPGQTGPEPKTPFPRTWNDERIIDVVAEIYSDPATQWTQQSGPGQGQVVRGLPSNPPRTAAGDPVRYRTDVVVDGITIRVVAEPGGEGLVTAFPRGVQDPAMLLQFVRPDVGSAAKDDAP